MKKFENSWDYLRDCEFLVGCFDDYLKNSLSSQAYRRVDLGCFSVSINSFTNEYVLFYPQPSKVIYIFDNLSELNDYLERCVFSLI